MSHMEEWAWRELVKQDWRHEQARREYHRRKVKREEFTRRHPLLARVRYWIWP